MSHPDSDFLVVGIGASAGGVEALQTFFAHVPPGSGCAYVVILHLSPEHESHLAELLQAVASLPVTVVTERVRVEPDHVYVVPQGQHLTMVDGDIQVSPNTLPEERRAPIDLFFRTLADSHDGRGVCVILSGSGSDGSMGLKRVKERGGAVFVQGPREAAFAEMPRSAIATDLVDDVLPVARIPARIAAYRERLGAITIPEEPEQRPEAQQQALREVFAQLRLRTGHDFSGYKRPMLLRRIARRITVRNLPDLPAYAAFLREHPDEVQALLKDLLISVTNFFRDRDSFATLEQELLPRLLAGKQAGDQLRLWVVGCATGEEAYSLAMLCAERTIDVVGAPSVQIFATDIDEAAIAHARQGLYSASDTADISPERLRRFFTPEGERYRVRPELRDMVLFAHHNILRDPPFAHLDLISCRNVLIYLDRSAQERVLEVLHFALNPGGSLFLGTAESADGASDLFAPLSREHRLFQQRPAGLRSLPLPEPGSEMLAGSLPAPAPAPAAARSLVTDTQMHERISVAGLHQHLLEEYAPPSLIVNADFEVAHVSEHAGRYLHIPAGEPTRNLLELIRPELRIELRAALNQALQHQMNVDTHAVSVQTDDRPELITIRVRPVLREDDPARGFVLVLFEAGAAPGELFEAGAAPREETELVVRSDEPRVRQLEEEVMRLQRQLRVSAEQYAYQTEELKATNEEQQALVEELRASSEELETSKEELQSINEELRTVNQELKVKVEEGSQTSADLQNLVNSTEIATIFLDRQLRIKRFTPAARGLFNLIPADRGRPLADLTHQLLEVDVLAIAQRVLAGLTPIEQEVRTSDDQVYVLRVLPYRVGEDRIGGVVLTFFDITERTRAQAVLRASEVRQSFLLRLSDALRELSDPIEVQATASRVLGEQLGSDRAYYVEIDEAKQEFVVARDWHQPGAPSHARRYPLDDWPMPWLVDGKTWVVRDVASDPAMPDDQREAYRGNDIGAAVVVPLIKDGRLVATLVTNQRAPRPWTAEEVALVEETAQRTWAAVERARAEEALGASEERFRRAIEEAPIPVIMHAEDGQVLQISRSWTELTGYTLAEVPTLDAWLNLAYGHGADAVRGHVHDLFAGEQRSLNVAFDIRTRAGELRHWSFSASSPGMLRDGRRFVVGMALDITERTRTERALAEQARLLDLSNDAIIVRDVDNRIIYWNRGATELYGWGREEAIGQDLHTLLHTEFEAPFAQLIAALHEHDRLEGEVVQSTRDGRRITALCRWALDRDAAGRPGAILTTYNDITARKQAEDALRANQERLEKALSIETVGVLFYTLDGGIVDANAAFERMSGYRREELRGGVHWEALTAPAFLEATARTTGALAEQGETAPYEKQMIRRDGSRWWGLCAPTRLSGSGRASECVEFIVDITEQKRAEAAVRESEARFRSVSDAVPQLIWTNSADGTADYFNGRWYEYSGLSYEQSAGLGWQAIVHPDDAPASLERWQHALAAGEIFETEYRLRRADGVYRWHLGRNVPVRDETSRIVSWFGSATDIEALKQAEAAVRESEERFRLLVEGARDYAMFLLDPENRITYWSVGAERVFGWSEAEALGQEGAIIFTQEDRAAGQPEHERDTASVDGSALDRRWHVRKDGTRLFLDGSLIRLDDEQGQLRGFVKIARDATRQRLAEEAVERANAELEWRVQERTAALTASNEARQELMGQLITAQEEERLRIARDLHDQLGQLITGLLLGLKQLEGQLEGSPALASLAPLQALALELAKESHRIAVNLRPTALEDVGLIPALERLVTDWSAQAGVPAAFMSVGFEQVRLPRPAEVALYRVAQEALTNAQKHATATNVSVVVERHDSMVMLVVEDNGRGFHAENLSADDERARLGLVGMRERMAQVGGVLEIETSPGGGTTVFARIALEALAAMA